MLESNGRSAKCVSYPTRLISATSFKTWNRFCKVTVLATWDTCSIQVFSLPSLYLICYIHHGPLVIFVV